MFDGQTEKLYINLIKEYGSPLFLINEKKIEESYENLSAALKKHHPHSFIAYSYKTNYLPAICETLARLGASAEIVSSFEYKLAKKISVEGKNIVWNGPHKTDEDLKNALKEKCYINIDNKEELLRLEKIAKEVETAANVGLRVYSESNARIFQTWSRFGFCIDDGEAESVIEGWPQNFPHLKIIGLHTHLGTNISHPDIYSDAIQKMGRFNSEFLKRHNVVLQYVDIGGGFPLESNKPRYLREWKVLPIEDYAKVIGQSFSEFFGGDIFLILEPGRFLVGDAMRLLTTVISKKVKSQEQQVVVDSSVSILPHAEYTDYPIRSVAKNRSDEINSILFGVSCMQTDVLGRTMLPNLNAGDLIEISGVGAYSVVRGSQWIILRPGVVIIKKDGGAKLVSNRENLEDVVFLK